MDSIKSELTEINSNRFIVFFDVETTGFDPLRNCVISLACIVLDTETGEVHRFYEACRPDALTQSYEHPSMKNFIVETWSPHAEKIHKISWRKATGEQHPSDLCMKLLRFIAPFYKENNNKKLPFVYYANAYFDWKMVKCLFTKNSDRMYYSFLRAFDFKQSYDLLKMMKAYSKQFSTQLDIIKENEKKFAKPRKKAIAKRYAEKWQAEINEANIKLEQLGGRVSFNAESLDEVCKTLGIKHDHHNALSDAEVLEPVFKFLMREFTLE